MTKQTRIRPGSVLVTDFPLASGASSKARPVICVANEDWDDPDSIMIVCSVSSSERRQEDRSSVAIENWQLAGLDRPSVAQIDRLFSTQRRYSQAILGDLSRSDWLRVAESIRANIERDLPE